MDRNREARRATNMAAPPNGLSSSRRRHRSNSLRDSPDEDGGVELQESGRLRDRGLVKKDRGDRDRDRERERERSSRSKRRRENRMMIHHVTAGSNRDDGDDTSEESVNDEDEDDDEEAGNGGGLRMLPPPPTNPSTASAAAMTSNHHNHNPHPQQLHHRKSFPPSANKVYRAAAPPPAWKAADEMIGVSVPRKARSASTKRSHEWISGGAVVSGGAGPEQNNRQSSTSPVRLSSAASPAPVAPLSPSSSNVSVRKKMKANGGGSKPRPPKSSSKSSSSNPEELEIEIAEVLYGLMTQAQAPAKKEIPSNDSTTKFDSNKSSSDTKSRVSSPISNSTAIPQNSTSLSTVAPKRKRPRQVSENPFSVRSSPVSPSIKTEIDHHQHHQSPKTDISSPYLENNSPASAVAAAADNGVSFPSSEPPLSLPKPPPEEEGKCDAGVVLTKEEVEKDSPAVGLNDGNSNTEAMITTAASTTASNLKVANPEPGSQKEEKFEIDLMAPPPQQRTSPESDRDVDFSDHKQITTQETSKNKEEEKLRKSEKEETMNLMDDQKKSKVGTIQETGESSKQVMNEERNIGLHIDLEKANKDSASMVSGSSNRSLHQALKHQQLSAKSETHTEKTAQPGSMPLPMSVANWPPMGYVAQGVISMDGNTMPPAAPIQPLFTHPRPKRCATHWYIARNIHYLQQFMKINPFWPAAPASAPMFGAKPCNLNVMPATELHGNIPQPVQDKGQGVGIFPGHTTTKDTKSSQTTAIPDPAQRKQQLLLQQAMPPVAPNNILHGPAFIFPFNQQQAVAASASVRPGSSKHGTTTTGGLGAASGAANSATVSTSATAAAPALSFNYPNISATETQYLAILQNNPYTFPIPAVGAPPNYRGNHPAQAMPLFNGSFYSSQMIHPSQIPQPPQQPPPTQPQNHHPSQSQQISQTHQNSSGSTSSSQKHLQAQQRQHQGSGAAVNGGASGNGGGSLHNSYPAHKPRSNQHSQQQNQHMNPPPQARHLENEVTGGEDSPSTADSRGSRAANTMGVYSHNFAMPVHSQNFALINPQAAGAAAIGNSNDKKQQPQQQQLSQQQGLKRGGVESSSLPPQTFAMSFAPMNGTTGTMSSVAQNHAIFQSLPESIRQSYHHMMAAPAVTASAHHSQQKKDFRASEEASRTAGHDPSNADEDRKVSSGMTAKSGQSIAFSRPDLATDVTGGSTPSLSGTSVIDSSSRTINLGSNNRSSRSPISTSAAAAAQANHLATQYAQQHQQQLYQIQLQKQQRDREAQNREAREREARSKNTPSSNGSAYPEHIITSSSSMAGKFPNSLSSFPLQTSNSSSSPVQSPQWRNSVRGPTTSQVPSSLASATTSSLKNLHQTHQSHQSHQSQQQQSSRPHSQSHTQISFGAASQKLQPTTSSQMQQQQQQQNQNPNSNSGNQCPSPPMLVGSPTTSSMSKGGGGGGGGGAAGGSPRTNATASTSGRTGQASSLSSSQQGAKNSSVGAQRSSPSILGNPNSSKSQQPQQPPKQTLQQQHAQAQAHMFFTHPYMQVQQPQAQQHSGSSTTASGYYLPRKQQQQLSQLQQQQNQQSSTSTAMLSLCPPVTLANTTTSDPAKVLAAATSNMKGGVGLVSQQGILHATQYGAATQSSMPAGFPQYVHNAPAAGAAATAVQVKPAEQKQPAGNDNLRTWQPEKK